MIAWRARNYTLTPFSAMGVECGFAAMILPRAMIAAMVLMSGRYW
jgi:hypothetical protein